MSTIQLNQNSEEVEVSKIKQIQDRYGDIDIIDMVHQFLTTENAANQQKRIEEGRLGKFYPSSIGRCKRSVVYQMLGYPTKPIPGQNLLIMENGTSFHNRMEDIFEKMGILVAPELSLKDEELRISGRSDAIIWNFLKSDDEEDAEEITLYDPNDKEKIIYQGPANHILIVEFKSIKSKNYLKLPKSKPDKKHEMQLQLYFYLTGIRRGMVYYENKDTQESKFFHVFYDEELVQQVKSDIKEILDYVDRRELPEKEGNALDIMCRYCDFRNLCHTPISEEEWLEMYFEEPEAS
ncbi:CRISPR-associated protein Cas4 [Priestia megaterium]|uniref:CRISPR-associated protein Cas4 n=1 Tax=Priestia megaterium TaxID=1404 RepID=UPI00211D406C|nr:PD-(D/E)XK nuclease family protein [Priestia megaterium]